MLYRRRFAVISIIGEFDTSLLEIVTWCLVFDSLPLSGHPVFLHTICLKFELVLVRSGSLRRFILILSFVVIWLQCMCTLVGIKRGPMFG